MHVISAQLGGEGKKNNLLSAPQSINSGYFLKFEHGTRDLAQAVQGTTKNVVWVEVNVDWRDDKIAETIAGQSGLYFWRGKKKGWVKNEKVFVSATATIPRPEFQAKDKISL